MEQVTYFVTYEAMVFIKDGHAPIVSSITMEPVLMCFNKE